MIRVVTSRKPGKRYADAPHVMEEEHRRVGDLADAMMQEFNSAGEKLTIGWYWWACWLHARLRPVRAVQFEPRRQRRFWLCLLTLSSCAPVPRPQPHRIVQHSPVISADCSTDQTMCPSPPNKNSREPTYVPHNSAMPSY
jgi:hypothetical protein